MLTTLIGLPIEEIDTPALLVDLDVLESNIKTMAADVKSRGSDWRPHSKSHKCPAIAHLQIEAGAIGIACAKLGEAEVMAANGIRDILVPNQIVGPIKSRRVAALATQTDICVAVDSVENIRELDEAAVRMGTHPRAVIEVDTGMERAGVLPGEPARKLAHEIANCKGLRFAGVMTWEGHCWAIDDPDERLREINKAVGSLVDTAEQIRADGIPVEIVSAGGTATYLTTSAIEGVTEIQAGGGIFGDTEYLEQGANVQRAIALMTQVTSRPTKDRIIVDAGRKTIDPGNRGPKPRGIELSKPIAFSAEHGIIRMAHPSDEPHVAERIYLEVGYSDQSNHLHENYYGVRNGVVEVIWPILGRGKLQ